MSNYTKGPWKVDILTLIGPPQRDVYRISRGGSPEGDSAANACLMEAAPDLLEACKLALKYLQHEGFKDGDAYPALVKAIAKAEGLNPS